MTQLRADWDDTFPGFPQRPSLYASLQGTLLRGSRDKHLKQIICYLIHLRRGGAAHTVLANPACVFGRHARDLAAQLPSTLVQAMDIDPVFNRLYAHVPWIRTPKNYTFRKDDVYNSALNVAPTAVVFFGACGSLTDAAMDMAIRLGTPLIACRACCHNNIAGNTAVQFRLTGQNLPFRLKNWLHFRKYKRRAGDHYFSVMYGTNKYPRSEAGKGLSGCAEFVSLARHSVDSDVCRTIIDLDRFLYLTEAGYETHYRGELFVAEGPE